MTEAEIVQANGLELRPGQHLFLVTLAEFTRNNLSGPITPNTLPIIATGIREANRLAQEWAKWQGVSKHHRIVSILRWDQLPGELARAGVITKEQFKETAHHD